MPVAAAAVRTLRRLLGPVGGGSAETEVLVAQYGGLRDDSASVMMEVRQTLLVPG